MRTRLWNSLANIHFKASYCSRCSDFAGASGRMYSFLLSLFSAGSVATWAIWQELPTLWAIFVGIAQVMLIAKPHIAFLGSEKEFLRMSFEFQRLYMDYEKLWYSFENGCVAEDNVEKSFYEFRQRENEIEHQHINAPEMKRLVCKAERDTKNALKLHFEMDDKS